MVSTLDAAKRVLVVLLRTLAATYNCAVGVTRDSSDAVIRKAYRTMSLKTHPDMNSQGALRSASVAASWLMNLRLRLNASGPGTRIQVRQEPEVGKNMQGGGSEQALGQAGSAPKAQVHPTCSPQAPKEPRRMAREGPRRQLD